jgi:hypothetical protein
MLVFCLFCCAKVRKSREIIFWISAVVFISATLPAYRQVGVALPMIIGIRDSALLRLPGLATTCQKLLLPLAYPPRPPYFENKKNHHGTH